MRIYGAKFASLAFLPNRTLKHSNRLKGNLFKEKYLNKYKENYIKEKAFLVDG